LFALFFEPIRKNWIEERCVTPLGECFLNHLEPR
jgi:hypothetical protein